MFHNIGILVEMEGKIHILWVSASNNVDRDQTPPKTSQILVYTNTQGSAMARVY